MKSTVCVDKIVDNTEQQLNQDSQSKQGSLSKQDIQWGKQTEYRQYEQYNLCRQDSR